MLIIDDVGTSMATKLDLVKKIEWLQPRAEKPIRIEGVALAVDREQTQAVYDAQGRVREGERGPDALAAFQAETGLKVWSLLGISQAIEFLHQARIPVRVEDEWRPLDAELLDMVREYLALYGRKP